VFCLFIYIYILTVILSNLYCFPFFWNFPFPLPSAFFIFSPQHHDKPVSLLLPQILFEGVHPLKNKRKSWTQWFFFGVEDERLTCTTSGWPTSTAYPGGLPAPRSSLSQNSSISPNQPAHLDPIETAERINCATVIGNIGILWNWHSAVLFSETGNTGHRYWLSPPIRYWAFLSDIGSFRYRIELCCRID
jgi:hypothetical protein